MTDPFTVTDPLGAFRAPGVSARHEVADGRLAGLTLAVKELFAVAGQVPGFGHPAWDAAHEAAASDAAAVRACLDAGATLAGRTVMDECAFSLSGVNPHHGAPANPEAPGRTAGGSSSGSAAAVAGGLADIALGTDTAGSVRVPASCCGLYGLRPTHGAIATDGVVPLAPRFDTVGLLARGPGQLTALGEVLLPEDTGPAPSGVALATDAFALAEEAAQRALTPVIAQLVRQFGDAGTITLAADGLDAWAEVFRVLQGRQVAATLHDWVATARPAFGPGVAERWAAATALTADQEAEADTALAAIAARLHSLTRDGSVIAVPCLPGAAPALNADEATWSAHRRTAVRLACAASLGGLPQVVLPLASVNTLPLAIGLIGPAGSDRALLDVAEAAQPAPADPGQRFEGVAG